MSSGSWPPSSVGIKRGNSVNVAAAGVLETVHEQVQSTLRIGDTVLLFSQEGQGFVYSDVSSDVIQSIVVHPTAPNYQWTEPHFLPNIHCACFKILAANKYKAQNRLKELKEECRGVKERIAQWKSGEKDHKQLQELRQSLKSAEESLKNAERNAIAEIADNELDQKRLEGQEVLYGNLIQLQHAFTGKYLTINSSATSLLESTNLKMELTSQNSRNCMFKILPRYKVRSVGDEVRTFDQVMFESVKTEGQFLHCSMRFFEYIRQHLHSECKELNLSASESAFTVCLHSHPLPEAKMDLLRAGGTIRLFHREIECYLVAEGSFAENPEGQVVENVHLRKRKSDHGKLKSPSTSAITYWTIEKKKEPLSGEPVLWYERCRIRHLLTQQYLAVERREGQNVLTLKESKPGPEFDQDTQFRLFPVISGEDEIKYETYTRINHPHTKTWLHANKGVVYHRKSFDPAATGLQGLRWDDADVFEATAYHQMAYDDAFTLMEVEDKLVHKFNLVAGYVPVLKEYKEDRKQRRPLTDKKAKLTSKALGELSRFMLDAYARQKDHQKLVRNLRILEQLVEFLELYKADAKDADHQRQMCRACYRIIEVFLQGDSRKNELYVSRFVPFFEGQMRLGLNAEDMLIELVRDNPNIVSRFSVKQIDRIVEHILKMEDKDCRMLDYLGVACVCEDKAAVPSQNYIVEQLLQKHGRKLFFTTEVREDHTHPEKPFEVFFRDKTGEMKPLTEIAHKRINRDEQKCTSTYRWLESQLDLFGRLAKGNNPSAIHTITVGMHFITFHEALVGANDPELHPSIRSKYVELIRVLFVDVGKNRAVLDSLPNSFVYREVKENPVEETEGDEDVALTGVANQYFGAMRDWLLKVVETNTRLVCADSHIGENLLLAQILGVLELLVKYGYYDDPKDIETLLEPFLSMLSGLNDTPGVNDKAVVETFQKVGRFQDTLANRAVFEVKKKIMEVCDLFFNYRFYLRLQRFAYDYRCLKGDVELGDARNDREGEVSIEIKQCVASPSGPSTPEQRTHGRRIRLPIALTVGHSTPPGELKKLETAGLMVYEDEWLMKVARERLKHIFKSTAFFEGTESDPRKHEFVKTLLDIAGYENNDLVVLALHLLNRYFSMESDLFEKATESQLLTTTRSIDIQKLVEERVARFRQYCLHDLDMAHMRELELILEQMTKLCMLDEDLEEPHEQNQKILYNHGLLSDVLNLLFDRLDSRAGTSHMDDNYRSTVGEATTEEEDDKKDSQVEVIEKLFARCFKFLVALARDNRVVKEHLFNRMDSLLAIGQAVPEMAKLLFEVFTNFQEVCLHVEESQIEEVFRIMKRVNGEAQAELLQMLRALTSTKVNEIYLPLKRNQAFIIKFYSKNRELFERVLGQEEDKKRQRLELLEDAPDNSGLLLLLLNTTDMLACCCEGTNPFIESICQTIFSVEELLEYLCNDNIVPERKRPFCRFLVWVYLSTNSEAALQLNLYSTNEKMLLYLRQSMEIVSGLAIALRGVPARSSNSVKRQLKRTKSDIFKVKRTVTRHRVKSMVHSVARVTSDTGELAVGILPYFMDGILPLLKVFYQQYLAVRHNTDDDEILPIMGEVACVLMGMVKVITPFLSNSDQAVLLRDCLLQLTSSPVINKYLVVSAEVHHRCEEFIRNATGTRSESMKKFQATYAAELKLNADFDAYVRGYELAYNGPNTIRHQLDLKGGQYLDEAYSEFLDADMKVRGDEYLPLGPSFQGLVSCFVSREGHQPMVLGSTRHLIRLLDISFNHLELQTESERVRQDLLDAKCLQMLRAIIHNEIKRIDPELKENEPETYRRMAVNIERVQNSIQELGDNPIASIVPMLAHHNDATAAEVLAFLSVFLYDGNERVQAGFAYLTQTREERFFVNIRKRLDHAVAIDTERRALVSQFQMKQADNKKLYDNYWEQTAKQRKPCGSPDVLATVLEMDEDREAYEMDTFGQGKHYGPAHDKSTAPLLPHTFSGLEADVEESDPNRWVLSDIFRQKCEEAKKAETTEKEAAENKKSKGADSDELRFQDSTYVELALRVLGLMCDGQNRTLQNYLREQPDNINNVNLVGEVALFLQHFYSDINQDNIELVNRIIQTLVEMCVGNYYSQDVIFDRQIMDIINRILQTSFFSGCKIAEAMQLKASAVELLEVMLEDTHKRSPELAQNIHKALDVAAMFRTLVYFYWLRDDPYLKDQQKDDDADRAMFRVFHVLRHLADFEGISREKVEATEPKLKPGATKEDQEAAQDTWDAWKYCMDHSKSVEVLYENLDGEKILSRLHFHYQPDDELPEEIIEKVKWSVSRDSAEEKVRDYLAWMKAVKREVLHVKQLREHWFTHMFIYKAQYQHWALVFLTLILNILLLISWKGPEALGSILAFEIRTKQLNFINNTNVTEKTARHLPNIPLVEEWFGYYALFILGAVHLVMTIMQVVAYFLVNRPNFYYKPEFVYRLRGKERKNASYSDIPFFGLRTVYYLLFLSCSILSLCFWGYFYSICLMHIVVNNDLLQRVLRSVTKNGKSLLWVAALGAVVLYIYAVIAYAGYQIYFDDPGNSSHCKTLFECVVSVFRLGLLNGALVTNAGSIFKEDDEALVSNFGLYIPRTIFDLTFFIIVTTVGLNIVFGIIVDTFSELRDERYKTEADKKGFCFICHIAAYEFDRRADGFDHHTRCEHNMWDYIYLCLELDRIDSSDQNAIQQYVSQQEGLDMREIEGLSQAIDAIGLLPLHIVIKDDSTSFFPTLRARCLKDEQDTTKEEIAELKEMMLKILDKLKEKRTPGLDQDEDDHIFTWDTSSVRDGVGTPPSSS